MKWVENPETHSCHKTSPWHSDIQLERNLHNLQLLPWVWRVLIQHLSPQLLRYVKDRYPNPETIESTRLIETKKQFLMAPEGSTCSWRRQRHSTPVLLPGKSHGRRILVGCSPWGHEETDTTERTHFHFSLSCIGEGNGNPLQCSYLENPRDGRAWWAAIYGVAQS